MANPTGRLTHEQLEILEVVWARNREGATVGEIYGTISQNRKVARTTIITMVTRLQRRGWLVRKGAARSFRYYAARKREQTTERLTKQFLDDVFDGSTSRLVMSLLGSKRISQEEIQNLKKIIKEQESK